MFLKEFTPLRYIDSYKNSLLLYRNRRKRTCNWRFET